MERRWTTRTNVILPVELAWEGGATLRCMTENIGLGGVFVRAPGQAIAEGQNVDLTFSLDAGSTKEQHHLRAKVVRATEGGLGLMFRDFDATAFRSLQRVMKVREFSG